MNRKSTAIVSGLQFGAHQPGPGHPESPERSAAVEAAVQDWAGPMLERLQPRTASPDEVLRVHDAAHLARISSTSDHERTRIDPDTSTSAASCTTALLAAGSLLELVDTIDRGEARNGFALVRPPGHHANRSIARGFCLFNNVAIAAMHLRQRYQRVAIIDFDVHHGNGTEEIFYADPQVLYASVHEAPWYPGTGAAADVGTDDGRGYNINLPLPAGAGDAEARLLFNDLLLPALYAFAPEFVLVSAGFDGHRLDPLANLQYTEAGYLDLTRQLRTLAETTADGRIAAVLEGGYHLSALRSSTEACLTALTMAESIAPWKDPLAEATKPLRDLHRDHGPLASTGIR